MTDDKLHTYTTPRLRHMLSAQQDSRDWKLSDLALIMEIIGELEREIACREQIPAAEDYGKIECKAEDLAEHHKRFLRKLNGIPERY